MRFISADPAATVKLNGISSILNLPLPNSGNYKGFTHSPLPLMTWIDIPVEVVASALSHISHLVNSLSMILNIKLPHPLLPFDTFESTIIRSHGNLSYVTHLPPSLLLIHFISFGIGNMSHSLPHFFLLLRPIHPRPRLFLNLQLEKIEILIEIELAISQMSWRCVMCCPLSENWSSCIPLKLQPTLRNLTRKMRNNSGVVKEKNRYTSFIFLNLDHLVKSPRRFLLPVKSLPPLRA
jgi:hypothetical protein